MIKQNQRKFNAIHILVDALSAVISIVISFLISDSIHKIDFNSTKIKSDSLKVVKVNINFDSALMEKYEVQASPTIIFFKDGQEQLRLRGAVKKSEIVDEIEKLK